MKHELWYSVVVRDRHGKVLSRERRRARSFLKAWNQLVFAQMSDVFLSGADGITDTGGTLRSMNAHADNFRVEIHTSLSGVMCGTGDTPVAIDDYALEAIIPSGTNPGQLTYVGMTTVGNVGIAGPSAQFLVSREFVNNSGSTITVKETGIYTTAFQSTTRRYICVVRDVLGVPQAVPDGGGITVDYTLEVVE